MYSIRLSRREPHFFKVNNTIAPFFFEELENVRAVILFQRPAIMKIVYTLNPKRNLLDVTLTEILLGRLQ